MHLAQIALVLVGLPLDPLRVFGGRLLRLGKALAKRVARSLLMPLHVAACPLNPQLRFLIKLRDRARRWRALARGSTLSHPKLVLSVMALASRAWLRSAGPSYSGIN